MEVQTLPERALDRVYRLPRDGRSLEDWKRNRNLDLAELSDLDLDREAFRVTARLAQDSELGRVAWLAGRRAAIHAEIGRRRAAIRVQSTCAALAIGSWQLERHQSAALPRLMAPRGTGFHLSAILLGSVLVIVAERFFLRWTWLETHPKRINLEIAALLLWLAATWTITSRGTRDVMLVALSTVVAVVVLIVSIL